jgi:23S rRNA (guanosine2251-2'-O)-methyltransferase
MQKLSMDQLNRLSVNEFKQVEKKPIVIVLDNVRSLHNVGSVFRTADGFAVEKVVLTGITGQPPHREIEKTALGATESMIWTYEKEVESSILQLKKDGYKIAAVEQVAGSVSLDKFQPDPEEKYALIFGNEVNGVSESVLKHVDVCLEIPQFGTKHSFNISITVGILLWDFYCKMR